MTDCGRPTLATGTPCKNPLIHPSWRACHLHRTKEDTAYMEGWSAALQWSRQVEQGVIEAERQNWFEQGRQQALREIRDGGSNLRFTDNGKQVAEIGRYAYVWAGQEPLQVGDRVLLPENWVSRLNGPGPFTGTITRLGTSYTGPLSEIIRKL